MLDRAKVVIDHKQKIAYAFSDEMKIIKVTDN